MATFLKATGNPTESSEFKYNTIYNRDNSVREDLDPTGNGNRAFIFNEYVATKYRDAKLEEHGLGKVFGLAEDCRSQTAFGDVTQEGNFSYNGGVTSETNIPSYFDDSIAEKELNRANTAYTINGNSVLARRNSRDEEDTDGVLDDGISHFN